MCVGSGEAQTEFKGETFFGVIKSFNIRRGFGFLSCQETAQLYGRDVYLSKDEAMTLAKAPEIGSGAASVDTASGKEKEKSKTGPVQEGDFLSFKVQLSSEGFPQAVRVQKIRRLRGVVSKPPSPTADGIIIVTGGDSPEVEANTHNVSDLEQLLGTYVKLPLSTCGQLQLMAGDEIAVCCINTAEVDGQALEAHRIDLLRTARDAGCVLGCFSLKLPQPTTKNVSDVDDAASTAASSEDSSDAELQGYALTDRVFVSELPSHFNKSDLIRFFSKIGGQADTVAQANGSDQSGFTCFTFSTTEQVAKFLSQASHTISENGITQLAHVGPCQSSTMSSGSEVSTRGESQALSLEAEVMQQASKLSCAPCAHVPTSPPRPEDTQGLLAPVHSMPAISRNPLPDWRCIHGSIVLAPAAPEVMALGESGLCMVWPTVVQASAYAVELLDQCTGISQRFVRTPNVGFVTALTDLQIDGLQAGSYAARVRCVAPCGCESAPSPWATLPLGFAASCGVPPSAPAVDVFLPPSAPAPVPALLPNVCPPPPNAPPSLPLTSIVAPASPPGFPEEVDDDVMNFNDEVLTLD